MAQDSSSIVGSVHYSQTGNSELPDSVKYSLFNLGRLVTPLVCGVRKVPAATYVVEQACNIPSLSESTKRRSDAAGYYIHGGWNTVSKREPVFLRPKLKQKYFLSKRHCPLRNSFTLYATFHFSIEFSVLGMISSPKMY